MAAPVITSFGGGDIGTVLRPDSFHGPFVITAIDADGSPLTYTIVGGADATLFTIANAWSPELGYFGYLFWSSELTQDHRSRSDANGNNIYEVTVQVSDGINTDTQALSIHVISQHDPVITSDGGGATAIISVPENSSAVTTVVAADADSTLTYGLGGMAMLICSSSMP
jgi:trimeric autotransporter adhesin